MSDIKNSEILFIYDASRCNPNGDMDNENKPRMDWDTNTNLVSDVRLKRYIRDYLKNVKGKELFVDECAADAKTRVSQIINKKKDLEVGDVDKICQQCIDVKLFGAVFATEGGNTHLTGPVQFNWGYSLNKVHLQESKTITSSFSSIGKDYRVVYSLIAFSGGINGKVAEKTHLSKEDISLLDEAMVKSIPFNRTRSKIGQTPRLYLRVELNNSNETLKDLRHYISAKPKDKKDETVMRLEDLEIDFDPLLSYLNENLKSINNIYCWTDDKLEIDLSRFDNKLKNFFEKE